MVWVIAASIIFGINPALISMSTSRGMEPVSQIFWMYAVSCVINFFCCRASGMPLKTEKNKALLMMTIGLIGMGGTGCLLTVSYQLIGTGTSTLIHFMYPAIVSGTACLLAKKFPNGKMISAIALSVLGVILLVQVNGGHNGGMKIFPAALSVLTYSFYFILNGRPFLKTLPSQAKCVWMTAGVWIGFGLYLLLRGRIIIPVDGFGVILILLTGISSAVAYNCLVYGIKKIGSEKAAFASLLEPLTSMFLGILAGGEAFTLKKGLGSMLILLSECCSTLSQQRRCSQWI